MTLAGLVLAFAALDAVTMLMLPPGAEVNPLAAALPPVAVVIKVVVGLSVARLVWARQRYFRGVGIVAASAWLVGTCANVVVLA